VDKDNRPIKTVAQAVVRINRLRTQCADNALPILARQTKFADYAKRILKQLEAGRGLRSWNCSDSKTSRHFCNPEIPCQLTSAITREAVPAGCVGHAGEVMAAGFETRMKGLNRRIIPTR